MESLTPARLLCTHESILGTDIEERIIGKLRQLIQLHAY